MSSAKKNDVISKAAHHTQKKFELISRYVEAWAEILLNSGKCNGIVYIDCMSNSGVYTDDHDDEIEGTALRVAEIIAKAAQRYPTKHAFLYFNDLAENKIDELNRRLPVATRNLHVYTTSMDASKLLYEISKNFTSKTQRIHYLLVYDPYKADIDWDALMPFLRNWGEVILNHMVSDTVRAARTATKQETIDKYERTYRTSIDNLLNIQGDQLAHEYERRIVEIAKSLSGREDQYYVASFPFFNKNNALVYNLIHCTGNQLGFDLFKEVAWKTFGDRSSDKSRRDGGECQQLAFNFDTNELEYENNEDAYCYTLRDVASYVQKEFRGRNNVPKEDVINYLSPHPIFPTRNYKRKIWGALTKYYGAQVRQSVIDFKDRSC